MPEFEWDPEKARINLGKHGVAFEDAVLVWADPLHLVRFDRMEEEERWHALVTVAGIVLLLVVHTYPGGEDDDRVRLVSARRATKAERRAYEDGGDR